MQNYKIVGLLKNSTNLCHAAVSVITGTQVKELHKMKAPKTELVTKLQVENKPRPTDNSPLTNTLTKYKGELYAKDLWKQSGLAIDNFYQQLKTEMIKGWIIEPDKAVMKEVGAEVTILTML